MPLLAINLSDRLYLQIKPLLEKELYQSFEAFIEIAAFNQLALERGATPSEILENGHRKHRIAENGAGTSHKHESAAPTVRAARPSANRKSVATMARLQPEEAKSAEPDFATAFQHLAHAQPKIDWVMLTHPDTDHTSEQRLFGQVNRLLPLKLACRWLAMNASNEGKWSTYDTVSDRLADDAATIGSLLERWDMENGRKRDELLSTGLPRKGNSASRDRFLSQFLARVTRGGEIYPGAICQYQLARFQDSAIVLTDRGMAFSAIENPILDKQNSTATTTLTPTESEFLTRQIIEWVPAERQDMRVVLQAVIAGQATPTEMTAAVRSRFPVDWSESVFQTHLSGLIARLGELRLIHRTWQGRNVRYEIGNQQQVESFLAGGEPS